MDNNSPLGMNQQPGGFPPASPMRPTTPPPTPPPPEITLRTMQSDMESLKQSGGAGSAPKPFTPPELTKELSRPAVPPPPMPKIPQSDFSSNRPAAPSMPSSAEQKIETEPTRGNSKKMIFWGLALILIIGAGVAGYLYVYPLLFPQLPPAIPAPAVTAPVAPAAPSPDTSTATGTPATAPATNTPVTAIPAPAIPAPLRTHVSLLASVSTTSPLTMSILNLTSLKLALGNASQKTAASDSLTEIKLSDAGGQLAASSVLPLMLPTFSADTVKKLFTDDFTTALYYDANGVWPVYILMINPNSSQVEAQPSVTSLELSANLANLFVSAPGAQSASGFKSGKVNGLDTRYLTFSKTGASLNMAWSGNKLVISTSYNGLKKVLGDLAK